MSKTQRPFVKSSDTSTSAVNSRSELDKMLRRYGASAIAMSEDIEARQILVSFIIPNSQAKNAVKVPVKLPISIYAVYDGLYGRPTRYAPKSDGSGYHHITDTRAYDQKKLEQAERVAWRNVVLWVDAALSAASVGLQTITEAFFAHAVVGEGGARMVEVVEQFQAQLGGGVQRLLMSESESE